MADLIERASAINALQYVLDSPNYSKALGEILRIPTADDFCSYGTRSKMEQVDKDINVRSKDEPQTEYRIGYYTPTNAEILKAIEDEPQTEAEIAKTIVHKMIDDAVIAEDAYPDLRQKMHDAVDEYEPQTEREGE